MTCFESFPLHSIFIFLALHQRLALLDLRHFAVGNIKSVAFDQQYFAKSVAYNQQLRQGQKFQPNSGFA